MNVEHASTDPSQAPREPFAANLARPFADYGALLFDLDGTLVDTMPLHFKAYAEALAGEGLTLTGPMFMALIGSPARVAIPKMIEATGDTARSADQIAALHDLKKVVFERLLDAEAPLPLAVSRVLAEWHDRLPCALVSSGNRRGVTAILARMGWSGWFGAIVSGDEIERGKPAPDPFLLAAAMLGVPPPDCLVFEDTADGLASARAAGMEAIDVREIATG